MLNFIPYIRLNKEGSKWPKLTVHQTKLINKQWRLESRWLIYYQVIWKDFTFVSSHWCLKSKTAKVDNVKACERDLELPLVLWCGSIYWVKCSQLSGQLISVLVLCCTFLTEDILPLFDATIFALISTIFASLLVPCTQQIMPKLVNLPRAWLRETLDTLIMWQLGLCYSKHGQG